MDRHHGKHHKNKAKETQLSVTHPVNGAKTEAVLQATAPVTLQGKTPTSGPAWEAVCREAQTAENALAMLYALTNPEPEPEAADPTTTYLSMGIFAILLVGAVTILGRTG